jgi:hypothetical protein
MRDMSTRHEEGTSLLRHHHISRLCHINASLMTIGFLDPIVGKFIAFDVFCIRSYIYLAYQISLLIAEPVIYAQIWDKILIFTCYW